MILDWDNPPVDLDSAVAQIVNGIQSGEERLRLKDAAGLHFGFGMALRNRWKLWVTDSPIVRWFWDTYQIQHADDISGMILAAVGSHLTGEPIDLYEQARHYHEHWARCGCGPDGRPLNSEN